MGGPAHASNTRSAVLDRRRGPQLSAEFGEPGRLRSGLVQVAAQSLVRCVLAEEVAEAESVDDGPFPVGDLEPLATGLADLDTTKVEGRGPEDVDDRRWMVDGGSV